MATSSSAARLLLSVVQSALKATIDASTSTQLARVDHVDRGIEAIVDGAHQSPSSTLPLAVFSKRPCAPRTHPSPIQDFSEVSDRSGKHGAKCCSLRKGTRKAVTGKRQRSQLTALVTEFPNRRDGTTAQTHAACYNSVYHVLSRLHISRLRVANEDLVTNV